MTARALAALLAASALGFALAPAHGADLKKGDKVQALANLHPDMNKHVMFTLNYQLQGGLIPVCSDITITKVAKKKLAFEYQGQIFQFGYEGFSEEAGISFQKAVQTYLGPACDKAAVQALGAADQEGVRVGTPKVGMTRQGVLLAMGRPPYHANPSLDAPAWTYWKNRYQRTILTFGADGKIAKIQ